MLLAHHMQLININLMIVDDPTRPKKGEIDMNNIFYIIGVIVVVLFIAGFFGLR
jgi:abortive infection bacteriophage resistance protein